MNQDFMRTKPILPLVLSMALPMMLSMLINSLYNIVDSMFVARLGEQARFPLFIRCRHSSFSSGWDSEWESTRRSLFLWERVKRKRLTGRRPRGFF